MLKFLKKLNPLRILKSLLKNELLKAVQEEGDKLQEQIKKALAEKGPGAVDQAFDKFQEALKNRIKNL